MADRQTFFAADHELTSQKAPNKVEGYKNGGDAYASISDLPTVVKHRRRKTIGGTNGTNKTKQTLPFLRLLCRDTARLNGRRSGTNDKADVRVLTMVTGG